LVFVWRSFYAMRIPEKEPEKAPPPERVPAESEVAAR